MQTPAHLIRPALCAQTRHCLDPFPYSLGLIRSQLGTDAIRHRDKEPGSKMRPQDRAKRRPMSHFSSLSSTPFATPLQSQSDKPSRDDGCRVERRGIDQNIGPSKDWNFVFHFFAVSNPQISLPLPKHLSQQVSQATARIAATLERILTERTKR